MPWRAIFIIALIAVLLAAYGVLMRRSDNDLTDTPVPAQQGYYLQNATVTETDATGVAYLKLHAEQITQNPADGSMKLQPVTLNYQSAPDAKWLLTANQGHLAAGSRIINFAGAVSIKPLNQANNHTELRTELLNIDTLNNLATAPGKIQFEMDRHHLTAVGLKYDLNRQTLQLESQLHGQFQAK